MVDRVERDLEELGARVSFPPTPDLRPIVLERLARPERRGWLPRAWPRASALALVTLLVLAGVAVGLGLVPGLRLTVVPALPSASVPADPLGTRLALGAPVSVDDVEDLAPEVLGRPDEAYVIGDDEIVSLVYRASEQLPELDGTAIGLLVQVVEGRVQPEAVEKLVVEVGATVTDVTVDGAPGFWISGPPHLLRYVGPEGDARAEATRLVGDVLVWQHGVTIYRIESGLGLEETLRIAQSTPR